MSLTDLLAAITRAMRADDLATAERLLDQLEERLGLEAAASVIAALLEDYDAAPVSPLAVWGPYQQSVAVVCA